MAVVTVLATARLTRLVTTDQITKPWRDALARRLPERWAYGLYCRCCASIWVAFVVVPLAWTFRSNPWALVPLAALAASQSTGLLARAEPAD